MAGLPDRGIRGSLEDAQDGSGACRSTQSAGRGADAAGGRPRVGVGARHRPEVRGSGGPGAEIGGAPRPRPVWDAVAERVQALLAESVRWTGGKQRLTATRLHELLLAEGHRVGVTVVKEAVAEWKRQRREVFVPLTYRPGDLAEVDFFEVLVDVDGTAPEGVALPDAADVLRPRLRVDLRAPGSNQLSRRARPRVCALRGRAGPRRRTTICARPSCGSWSAARAR